MYNTNEISNKKNNKYNKNLQFLLKVFTLFLLILHCAVIERMYVQKSKSDNLTLFIDINTNIIHISQVKIIHNNFKKLIVHIYKVDRYYTKDTL